MEGTPSPSQKRVWAKKLDPYGDEYTVSVGSDGSSSTTTEEKSVMKSTVVTVQEV